MGAGERGVQPARTLQLQEPRFISRAMFLSAYTGVRLKVVLGPGDFPESIAESCSWLHLGAVCYNPQVNTHPSNKQ